jgi:hypothetical protein
VVPDSNYNSAVPVLIGTNILSSFIDQLQGTYGDRYLQDAHLFTSVYMALRCLTLTVDTDEPVSIKEIVLVVPTITLTSFEVPTKLDK